MDARAPIDRICGWASLLAASLHFGCASLPERVDRYAASGEFVEARRLLDDADAAEAAAADLPPDLQEARERFTTRVEDHHLRDAGALERRGDFVAACDRIRAGASLAPWSRRLAARREDCERRIGRLDALAARWQAAPASADEARRFLADLESVGSDHLARPSLVAARDAARRRILDEWTMQWKAGPHFVTPASRETFQRDLAALDLSQLDSDPCIGVAVDISLASSDPEEPFRLEPHRVAVGRAATCLRLRREFEEGTEARAIEDASRAWLDRWFRQILPTAAEREPPSFAGIGAYESLLEDHPGVVTNRLRCAVADLHLRAAEARAGSGNAAALALLHLTRATELCSDLASARVEATREKAVSSVIAGEAFGVEIGIVAAPSVDPQLYELVRMAIIAYLRNASTYGFAWRFLPPGERSRGANIVVEAVDFRIPDLDALPRVSSSYYSHTETVPNARKAYLRAEIQNQKMQVDAAENAVESALLAFGAYPTDYGLYAVNRARTEYARQVDLYNALVRQYNAMPDTVEEPVFLPYTFVEGNVEFGWDVTISYAFGSTRGRGRGRSMDAGFVRIGTRYDDRDASRRSDQALDFEVSPARMLTHLVGAVGEIAGELAPDLGELVQFKFAAGLSEDEVQVVRWMFHPLDSTRELAQSMGVAPWAVAAAERIEMPTPAFKPPATMLTASPERPPVPMKPSVAARWFAGLVGEVVARGPEGTSLSSGAIVSGDGLVLTCAHGLEGNQLSIRFSAGAWAGTYPAEVVFVNERTDTALLRAKGLRTSRWMEVRLDAPAEKGEEVVAIGNPSLPGGTHSVEAISSGIVSSPESPFYGLPRLVADVAIASGSSGGPVISLRDGRIVGVVVAVARAELTAGRAASRAVSLAAPAHRLGEWLGLEGAKAMRSSRR